MAMDHVDLGIGTKISHLGKILYPLRPALRVSHRAGVSLLIDNDKASQRDSATRDLYLNRAVVLPRLTRY